MLSVQYEVNREVDEWDHNDKRLKKTAETLENLREKLGAASLDETIQSLVKKQRKAILEGTFGADKGRIKPFTETDRGRP